MQSREELSAALRNNHEQFVATIRSIPAKDQQTALPGKWSPAQIAHHLLLSIRPVALAFGLPAVVLRLLFGKANRPSRTYDELVARYQRKLAEGGRATRPFVPSAAVQVAATRAAISNNIDQLARRVNRFSESELDQLLLPHPLLGKLTLREMVYFTIYHAHHHERQINPRA
jgi:hypothetical protein